MIFRHHKHPLSELCLIPLRVFLTQRIKVVSETDTKSASITMTNTSPDRLLHEVSQSDAFIHRSTEEDTEPQNGLKQHSQDLPTSSDVNEPLLKGEFRPFVGIRQYTDVFSPKLAKPGFIKRSRLIFDQISPKLTQDYSGWYIAIEPDSGDYFIDANKAVARQKARQKHPFGIICTLQLIERGANRTA